MLRTQTRRAGASGNCLLLACVQHRVVFVALIQGVVRAFNEHFRPLDQGRRKKSGKRADDDFLEKRGVHSRFSSSEGAIAP